MSVRTMAASFDEKRIDAIFAELDQSHLPGAAVAIAIDGSPVYRKGFGLANMELPAVLTPRMRMRIGSTTKHFACLAYLLLVEDGLAGLDDEIGRFVPGLTPVNARVSIRQLMTHTSGIRDVLPMTLALHGFDHPVLDRDALAYYRTIEDCDFAPGTSWSYNNGGYMLLSAAIEAISGLSLEDVLASRIFGPIGMHDTLLRRQNSDFVPNSATLHSRDEKGTFSKPHMGMEISGAGGMVSTMDDMLLWLRHMGAPFVGSERSWELMRQPYRLANGVATNYGFGLAMQTYRGTDILGHAGGVPGGNSDMIKVPAAGLDISIALNRTDISASLLAKRIIDACVEGLEDMPVAQDYEKRTGTFVSKATGRVIALSEKDGVHMMAIDAGPPVPLARKADGTLRQVAVPFIDQTVNVDQTDIVFRHFGSEDRLSEFETIAAADLGDDAGTYRSDAMDATLTLEQDAVGVRGTTRGRHGWTRYALTPLASRMWRIDNIAFPQISGVLSFDTDGEGLILDFAPLRRVRFAKVR